MSAHPHLLERLAATVLGLYLLGTAMSAFARGHWYYVDYLGLRVPAVLSVLAGVLALVYGVLGGRKGRSR